MALSPLGLLPSGWAVALWSALNLGLAGLACALALRAHGAVGGTRWTAATWLPILMFLSWGGFRTLLQFSLLTLVLGLAAVVHADRRPVWSGVSLGLALMKPQMAVPFALWTVLTGRYRVAGYAALTSARCWVSGSVTLESPTERPEPLPRSCCSASWRLPAGNRERDARGSSSPRRRPCACGRS